MEIWKTHKNWCTVTVAPTIKHQGGHSRTPANQRWDQVPGGSQRLYNMVIIYELENKICWISKLQIGARGSQRLYNMVIIYELENKMCWISKLQIDHDFWQVLYLTHVIQAHKKIGMNQNRKCLIQSNVNLYTVPVRHDSPHNSIHMLM